AISPLERGGARASVIGGGGWAPPILQLTWLLTRDPGSLRASLSPSWAESATWAA
ncbi:hypothetical protein A2U01_0090877, partial [Trifolium medium]|nr:hypothetical protein [Trifolium medium]